MKLISERYRKLNAELHTRPGVVFGGRGYRRADEIKVLIREWGITSVIDYGCGTASLSKSLDVEVMNYDPAVPEYAALPEPADLVVCTDVLEHIEPECLSDVLEHIKSLARVGVYAAIATRPDGSKLLADGTNPHKIIENGDWWSKKLTEAWGSIKLVDHEREAIVSARWV